MTNVGVNLSGRGEINITGKVNSWLTRGRQKKAPHLVTSKGKSATRTGKSV